jgi:5-formyltetrahydrofolate cyclo-ligase
MSADLQTQKLRNVIRKQVRAARRGLTHPQRQYLSHALCQQIVRSGCLLRARRLACFYPQDGEVDLSPLFARLWQMGKQIYLPVIPGPRLWFQPYNPQTRLLDNCYAIPEPVTSASKRIPLQALDLVLMPLVAFDLNGNRIGMGGGFYDRTFAYLHGRRHWRRPRLVGVGFELQHVPNLQAQAWDVPLDAAVTESKFYNFRR